MDNCWRAAVPSSQLYMVTFHRKQKKKGKLPFTKKGNGINTPSREERWNCFYWFGQLSFQHDLAKYPFQNLFTLGRWQAIKLFPSRNIPLEQLLKALWHGVWRYRLFEHLTWNPFLHLLSATAEPCSWLWPMTRVGKFGSGSLSKHRHLIWYTPRGKKHDHCCHFVPL